MHLIWFIFMLSSCGGGTGKSCQTVCECKPIALEQPAGTCVDANKDGLPDDGSENCSCTCFEVCSSSGGKGEGGGDGGDGGGDGGGESCGPGGC